MRKTKAADSDAEKLAGSVQRLREVSHRLSNQLEIIIQCEYLLQEMGSPQREEKWMAVLRQASAEAVAANREIRELVQTLAMEVSGAMERPTRKHAADSTASASGKLKKMRTLFFKGPS